LAACSTIMSVWRDRPSAQTRAVKKHRNRFENQ
jgi:hypothetical protein